MRSMLLLGVLGPLALAGAETLKQDHVEVSYEGIEEAQATALAKTIAAARKIYAEDMAFDMPETVFLNVRCGPDEPTRLYTDGNDRMYLSLPSKDKLAKPATSGVFNLYGMCHELGHVAMYRVLKDRDWMSGAAAEGWAHYGGSVVVDRVYAAEGESLWPDRYDYREDGSARLEKALAGKRPSPVDQGAGQWRKLEKLIGPKGFAKLFKAWQDAGIDATKPKEALIATAINLTPDKKADLTAWWKDAVGLLVEEVTASKIKAIRIAASKLTGQPITLAYDDDASEGKKSIAGGGHARQFSAPGAGEWYIRAVSVYGQRYGHPKPPAEQFDVALCDDQMKPISVFKKPYATFSRDAMQWVRMETPPTRVPATFFVCLNFRPTGTKGVYVAWDSSTKGNSQVAVPGKAGSPFNDGDWMIRVELDQPKEADPLGP